MRKHLIETHASLGVEAGDSLYTSAYPRWRILGFSVATKRRFPFVLIWRKDAPIWRYTVFEVLDDTSVILYEPER